MVATEGAMLSPTYEQPPLLACVFGELGHLHPRRPCRYIKRLGLDEFGGLE